MLDRLRQQVRGFVDSVALMGFMIACFVVAAIQLLAKDWFTRWVYDFESPLRAARGPFVLVLRSFEGDMAYSRSREWSRLVDDDGDAPSSTMHLYNDVFEGVLDKCTAETFVVIGWGHRLSRRVLCVNTPDDRWWDAFRIAVRRAKAILVLPEASHGLVREIDHVLNEHIENLVLLMPPSRPGKSEPSSDDTFLTWTEALDRAGAWDLAIEAFGRLGIALPAYSNAGALLRVDRDRAQGVVIAPWTIDAIRTQLEQSSGSGSGDIQQLVRELRRAGIPLKRVPRAKR